MNAPSKSNTVGSLAGLVSGFVVAKLTSAAFVVAAATFLGVPETFVLSAIGVVVASLVNYGVTHYGELKELQGLIPVDSFPQDVQPTTTQTNLKLK